MEDNKEDIVENAKPIIEPISKEADNIYERVHVRPMHKDRYKLLKEFRYKDIIVPVGFETNGADIPRIFWSLLPPNRADYLPAVIIHDYLCDLAEYKKADEYFEMILKDLEIKHITRKVMVSTVTFYHKIKYGV